MSEAISGAFPSSGREFGGLLPENLGSKTHLPPLCLGLAGPPLGQRRLGRGATRRPRALAICRLNRASPADDIKKNEIPRTVSAESSLFPTRRKSGRGARQCFPARISPRGNA